MKQIGYARIHTRQFLPEVVLTGTLLGSSISRKYPKTAPHWARQAVAGLQGGRYSTHFEVVRVVRLAAYMLEKVHTGTKNDFFLR